MGWTLEGVELSQDCGVVGLELTVDCVGRENIVVFPVNDARPRATLRLSLAIRSVDIGKQWSGPVNSI